MKPQSISAISVIISVLIAGCAGDKKAFDAAKGSHTIPGYQQFVKDYPKSPFTKEARDQLAYLNFKKTRETDTVDAYQQFLKNFPNSPQFQEANNRIELLRFKEAVSTDTVTAYSRFLQEFPNGSKSSEAKDRIIEFEYNYAATENTVDALSEFLKYYPQSRFAAEAKSKLKPLREEAEARKEKRMFALARQKDSDDAYLSFIIEYPDGLFIHRAIERLREVECTKVVNELLVRWEEFQGAAVTGANDEFPYGLNVDKFGNSIRVQVGVEYLMVGPKKLWLFKEGTILTFGLLDVKTDKSSFGSKIDKTRTVARVKSLTFGDFKIGWTEVVNANMRFFGFARVEKDGLVFLKNSLVVVPNSPHSPKKSSQFLGDEISEILRKADGGFSRGNKSEAEKLYQQAADLGSPDGHFALAYKFSLPLKQRAFHYAEAAKQGHEKALNYALNTLFFGAGDFRVSNPHLALEVYSQARAANPTIPEHPQFSTLSKCTKVKPLDIQSFFSKYQIMEPDNLVHNPYIFWELAEEISRGGKLGTPNAELVLQLVCRGGNIPSEIPSAVTTAYGWWEKGLSPNFRVCDYVTKPGAMPRCDGSPSSQDYSDSTRALNSNSPKDLNNVPLQVAVAPTKKELPEDGIHEFPISRSTGAAPFLSQNLQDAAENGNLGLTKIFLDKGVNVNWQNPVGGTALMLAAKGGHLDAVRLLLAQGADPHIQTNEGWTALMVAGQAHHVTVVNTLLDRGVDPDQTKNNGKSALILAIEDRDKVIVQGLLEGGAQPNLPNKEGKTPLELARETGQEDIVVLLKKYGGLNGGGSNVIEGEKEQAQPTTYDPSLMEAKYGFTPHCFHKLHGQQDTVPIEKRNFSDESLLSYQNLQDQFFWDGKERLWKWGETAGTKMGNGSTLLLSDKTYEPGYGVPFEMGFQAEGFGKLCVGNLQINGRIGFEPEGIRFFEGTTLYFPANKEYLKHSSKPSSATLLSQYLAEVEDTIDQKWLAPSLQHDMKNDVKVTFQISPSGQVSHVRFKQKSGNPEFDQVAAQVFLIPDLLPPFPEGLRKPFLIVNKTFTDVRK